MDEVISELNLTLAECRAHIALEGKDDQALEHVTDAVRKIALAIELLKSIE